MTPALLQFLPFGEVAEGFFIDGSWLLGLNEQFDSNRHSIIVLCLNQRKMLETLSFRQFESHCPFATGHGKFAFYLDAAYTKGCVGFLDGRTEGSFSMEGGFMRRSFPLVVLCVLVFTTIAFPQSSFQRTVKSDLAAWSTVMEMFIMDDGHYPEASSVEVLAQEAFSRQYWEQPIVTDPSGRPYQGSSSNNHYRIATKDGTAFIENGFKLPIVKPEPAPNSAAISIAAPRNPDTSLIISKSGNNIVLTWSGAGSQYDGAMGTGPRFFSERTLFTGSTASSYIYNNGMLNYDETFLCFDVTDQTEQNHGGYWNGGVLPPPPPYINTSSPSTTIGSLFVGSTGTIVGTGFSTIAADNYICFSGGVCTPATTATSTQVQFTTPPGAVSGNLTVQVGSQVSDPTTAFVSLEDPAAGWTIRTIGYAPLTADYWMAGNGPAGQSIYRVYYDSGTKKWIKSDQRGGMSTQLIYCSGQTSRDSTYFHGRLFCGYGTNSVAGGTRYVDTNPAGTLNTCINLGGNSSTVNVRGAAADPNPNGISGRDVAYFAFADAGSSNFRIKQVSDDCSTVLNANYGNYNWSGVWGSIVGMTVDPVTGDLYVASTTTVFKIDTSQNITSVKGGFTSIYGLDLFRQSSGDPGFLLVADAGTSGAGYLKAFALDNAATTPLTVTSVSNMRSANWGGLVFSQATPNATNSIRKVVLYNNGNNGATCPVREDPFIMVLPTQDAQLWISAPSPEYGWGFGPPDQPYVRPSDPTNTDFSLGKVTMSYKDGKARQTCAFIGDPTSLAAYEPAPSNPDNCDKPRLKVTANCYRKLRQQG